MTSSNKIVLLGEQSVGKTSIAMRIARREFNVIYESTIGAAYHNVKINDKMKLDIWDTAGQERYLSLTPMYYRNAVVILLVFDLTKLDTLDRLVTYLEKIMDENIKDYSCIVVGSKKDLVDNYQLKKKIPVITDTFERFNPHLSRNIKYIYTSAKKNENIDELEEEIIDICKNKSKEGLDADDDVVTVDESNALISRISGCSC